MSGDGHCDHCVLLCEGGIILKEMGFPEYLHESAFANWHTGHCPACHAERSTLARVAEFLRDRASYESTRIHLDGATALEYAAIALEQDTPPWKLGDTDD